MTKQRANIEISKQADSRQRPAGKKGDFNMKSKKELLQMFYSTLWELQNNNNINTYVKSSLKRDLALLIDILENEIDDEYVEQAETLLSV
jgi:hypothetical protein